MTTTDLMVGSHDYRLVALSILISILAAYAANSLVDRLKDARGRVWFGWLIGGATADGIGIWSMHFTAMLGYRLPLPVQYDWPTVAISLLVGIFGSAAALIALSQSEIGWLCTWGAGIFMGGMGISGMHYSAMAAMRLQGMHHYDITLVILSVALAIVISSMAVTVLQNATLSRRWRIHGGAVLRGLANPVMHFTAMAAIAFMSVSELPDLSHAVSISSIGVIGISIVPVMVLVVGILTPVADRLRKQRTLLDELFEQAPQAVALVSADDRIVRVNREFTRLFGYSPQETVGSRLDELTVPDDALEEYQRLAEMSAHGQRVDAESIRKRKDGSRLQTSIIRVPVSVPREEIETYAIYRDITERKLAEEELRASRAQLRALAAYLQTVREAERKHIARELHDEIGEGLTAIKLALERSASGQPADATTELARALALANELIGRVRDLSLELRPAMLDDLGLMAALRWHFERYSDQFKIAVDFKHSDLADRRFSPESETAAYRIVQEALTNVARHAQIDKVAVQLDVDEDLLRVQIKDEGVGFDPDSLPAEKAGGLTGMRERAIMLGGRLWLESAAGLGTMLRAEIPLHKHGPIDDC